MRFSFEGNYAQVIKPKCNPNGKWALKTEYMHAFPDTEIELLKEYYTMSYKSLEDKRILVETKYKIGEQISSLLDKIIDKKSFEIKEDVLQESNDIVLFDNVKFSDVIKNISVDKDKKRILF